MRRIITVAVREYEAAVRTKTFLISMVMMPVLMSGGIIAQAITERAVDVKDKTFVVVDHTGRLFEPLAEAARQRNEADIFEAGDDDDQDSRQVASRFVLERVEPAGRGLAELRLELSDRIRQKEIAGMLEIDAGAFQADLNDPAANPVTYRSDSPLYKDFRQWVAGPISEAIQADRFEQQGLARDEVQWAIQRVWTPKDQGLVSKVDGRIEEAGAEQAGARIGVGIILTMLLFMVIAIGATPLLSVVLEEKAHGIVEVLLGSIPPFELMLGKLLGSVGVSVTMVIVYLAGGYAVVLKLGYAEFLPALSLLIWYLLFLVTAIYLFGAMFLAIGAACSDQREAQSALLPVWLVVCIPMFAMRIIIEQPSSSFSTGISLFPLATPMLMPLRLAVDPSLPLWQPLLGLVLTLLATALCVFAASRIFRVGILMQGKGAKVGEVLRWVVRG